MSGFKNLLRGKLLFSLYLFFATNAGIIIGLLTGIRYLIPILVSLPAYLLMIYLLKKNRRREAVAYMLLWAIILGTCMTIACYVSPSAAEDSIIRGTVYRDEMFRWIKTSIGKEGNPREFIPEHLFHLSVFIILSLVTLSSVSIMFGAVLMNYMAFYVSQLMLHTSKPLLVFILGWHFWSLFRIVAFVILGTVLSEYLLHRISKYDWDLRKIKTYIVISAVLILLDIITKALFAPMMGNLLSTLVQV